MQRRRNPAKVLVLATVLSFVSTTACFDDVLNDIGNDIGCAFNLTENCCEDHDPRCRLAHDDEDHSDYCDCPDGRWTP